jgi:dTDP-4-amino-4,6-dideoxygalactose transaminase
VEEAITPRTKVIIPVHLFGQCAEMNVLWTIAKRHDVWMVEDAAQAIGAEFHGRAAGSWGDVGCFSFYPTKNLGGCGDGGMLTTNDAERERKLRLLAAHGMDPRYYHRVVGINSRLDSIQAAALNVKLARLDHWTAERQANAARYHAMFADAKLDRTVQLPEAMPHRKHVWNQYTIRVPEARRDPLRDYLSRCGVGTEVYYPLPLHLQECFASLGYGPGSLPETERACREVLSLPIFPGLTADEQLYVVHRIRDFFAARQAIAA